MLNGHRNLIAGIFLLVHQLRRAIVETNLHTIFHIIYAQFVFIQLYIYFCICRIGVHAIWLRSFTGRVRTIGISSSTL